MGSTPYSLRKKLLIWLLVPLLTLFVARGIYNYYLSIKLSNQVYDSALQSIARALLQQITFVDGKPRVNLSRSAHDILLYDEYDQVFFAVRDADGKVIEGKENLPPLPVLIDGKPDYHFYDGYVQNKQVRIVTLPIPDKSGYANRMSHVQVAETLTKRKNLANEIVVNILVPQMFIIIFASAVIWFGVGFGLSPLKKLQIALMRRSHLDLSPIKESNVPDEVRMLILSINDLMRRLMIVLNTQNRFIADAAHQLRTPLAGLMAQAEFALRQSDSASYMHSMQQVHISAGRISRLVHQLLMLARSESDALKTMEKILVELNNLVSETVMEWVPAALKKGIDLGFEREGQPVKIVGDPLLLKEMVNNLLDNAIRYTEPEGKVTVRLLSKGAISLIVEDTGVGIPAEERERVFDRFYRLLDNEADGSGLGLAIVRSLARLHRAEVLITGNLSGKGTVVKVTFWHVSV